MVITIFFLFGIVIGSFLNVCITRIPEELSIVQPGSQCPRCKTPIKPYDNLPILSWIFLRGKCRACGLPISPMYPLIELLTGLLFVVCYLNYGLTQETFKWVFFSCLIIVLTITDLRVRMLPDAVIWPGFGAGLVFSAFIPPDDGIALLLFWRLPPFAHRDIIFGLLSAALGAAFGSLLLWGAGALMGLRETFLTILVGTLLGSIIGLSVVLALYVGGWKRRLAERASRRGLGAVGSLRWAIASQYQLPLGTFLGIAALIVVHVTTVVSRWRPFLI